MTRKVKKSALADGTIEAVNLLQSGEGENQRIQLFEIPEFGKIQANR